MGERLAKEVDAILKAKIEQSPLWRRAIREGGARPEDAPELLFTMANTLREVVLFVAREVDDLPRADKP
jgi:hypothetical protein